MKNYIAILLLCAFFSASAQTTKNVENHQFSINILLPGVVYEAGLTKNSTIASEVTFGFTIQESDFGANGYGIYPIGRLQYRNYYNLERRLAKNKRIQGNSGNYVAPTIALQSGNALVGDLDFNSNFFAAVGAVYGIQRTAPKGFQFRLEAGPAYTFDEFDGGFGLFLAAKIGWTLGKKK